MLQQSTSFSYLTPYIQHKRNEIQRTLPAEVSQSVSSGFELMETRVRLFLPPSLFRSSR